MNQYLHVQSADATELTLELAGLGARSYAFITDWHIRLLLALAWLGPAWLLLELDALGYFGDIGGEVWPVLVVFVPAGLIYALYHPVLEAIMGGRTPGKRMAGVRIVTLEGRTPALGPILVRNVFRLIDSLPGFYIVGLATVALTRDQVRVGDLAAGTVLVYEQAGVKGGVARTMAGDTGLSPQDRELLLELLDRWPGLQDAARRDLGARFLRRVNRPVPDTKTRHLHRQLKDLADER